MNEEYIKPEFEVIYLTDDAVLTSEVREDSGDLDLDVEDDGSDT